MTLSDALFSTRGCFVTINGWRADVSSKLALLKAGLCNVRAVDPAEEDKADELRYSPVEDTGIYACNDVFLVELAARHWLWLQGDDFADKAAEIHTNPVASAMALQQHLTTLNSY